MRTTAYFREEVLRKRPYLKEEWILQTVLNPEATAIQADGRLRHWRYIPEIGQVLRVVTLHDGVTVHNALSRSRVPRPVRMKLTYHSDTDSLYIDLADRPSVDSLEVLPGVVLDLDEAGSLVGIDIDHASEHLDLWARGDTSIPVHVVPAPPP